MSYTTNSNAHPASPSPVPAEQHRLSVVLPVEQADKNTLPTGSRNTSSVLDAIDHSGMPLPKREARSQRPTPPPRRYRDQARRLVDTRALDRQAWLSIRQSGIGSSDAAAAVGLHPYKSQLELWMDKTGRQFDIKEPSRDEQLTSPLHWGQVLEPIVADHYAQHTGFRVQRVNAILQHVEHPWMLANLDREIVGNDAVQILECKTAGIYGAKLWKEGVPEYVQLQVMHQLAVTGQQAADVAVLLGGHELQVHRIERDEAMIDQLISLERQFWTFVENDTPPPADGTDSADQALRVLFPSDDGETIDLCQDEALSQAFADLQRVRKTLDGAKREEAKLKHRLQQAMGTATLATFPTGSLSWKQSKPINRLDTKTLQKEHPALCADYLHAHPGTRRLVVRQ
jgi:putative phage-type endonuclease